MNVLSLESNAETLERQVSHLWECAAAGWNEMRTGPDIGLMKGMILCLRDAIVFGSVTVRRLLDRKGGGEHAERDHSEQKDCNGKQGHGQRLDTRNSNDDAHSATWDAAYSWSTW